MHDFHTNGKLEKGSNPSFIVLIPKKDCSLAIDDFRPILLIRCLYKIIVKVLALRVSKVLNLIVLDCQSAFFGGRQITDGIIILNEIIDEIKKRKKCSFIFKIDFDKAYDSVD